MGHTEAPAWWADVQHLRDVVERTDEARRRADLADVAERRASIEPAPAERRASIEPAPAELPGRRVSDGARPAPVARRGPHTRGTALPARRTVEIRGRPVPAPAVPRVELDRRRPPRRAMERVGPHPDRLALWALLMGLVLILVAVGTADASVLAR